MIESHNDKIESSFEDVISWYREVMEKHYLESSKDIRKALIINILFNFIVFLVLAIALTVIVHHYIYAHIVLDFVLVTLGLIYAFLKGIFVGSKSVYKKYHSLT